MTTITTTRSVLLPIADVIVDPDIQSRSRIDPVRLGEYIMRYREGDPYSLGELDAFADPVSGECILANGFTRTEAAVKSGLTHLPYLVREGNRRAAALFSLSANLGAPATDEDRHHAAKKALLDPEWGKWSDRKIATLTGYSHTSVGKLRKKLIDSGLLSNLDSSGRVYERLGKQQEMRVDSIGASRPASVSGLRGDAPEAKDEPPPEEPSRVIEATPVFRVGDSVITRTGHPGEVIRANGQLIMVRTANATHEHLARTLTLAASEEETESPDELTTNGALSPSPDDVLTADERTTLAVLYGVDSWLMNDQLRGFMRGCLVGLVERRLAERHDLEGVPYYRILDAGCVALGAPIKAIPTFEEYEAGGPVGPPPDDSISQWMTTQGSVQREADIEKRREQLDERNTPGAKMRATLQALDGLESCWRVVAHRDTKDEYTAAFDLEGAKTVREAQALATRYNNRLQMAGYTTLISGADIDPTLSFSGMPTPMVRFRNGIHEQSGDAKAISSDDYFTRPDHIALVREVLGDIELDPASCAAANTIVQARRYFDIEHDGLKQPWTARTLYTNPPYSKDGQGVGNQHKFLSYLNTQFEAGYVDHAIALVTAATAEVWFKENVWDWQRPVCIVNGRITFYAVNQSGELFEMGGGLRGGGAFVLFTADMEVVSRFYRVFGRIGEMHLSREMYRALDEWEALNVAVSG